MTKPQAVVPLPLSREVERTVDAPNLSDALSSLVGSMRDGFASMAPDDVTLELNMFTGAERSSAHLKLRLYKRP